MSDVANRALFDARFLSVSVITKTKIKRAPDRARFATADISLSCIANCGAVHYPARVPRMLSFFSSFAICKRSERQISKLSKAVQ